MPDTDTRFREIKLMVFGIYLTVLGVGIGGTVTGLQLGGTIAVIVGLVLLLVGLFVMGAGFRGLE